MMAHEIIRNVIDNTSTVEQAAAELLGLNSYAATTFEYPSAFTLGLDVTYNNGMVFGGRDAEQYQTERDTFCRVQAAAKKLLLPLVAGDSFTVCNGCAE